MALCGWDVYVSFNHCLRFIHFLYAHSKTLLAFGPMHVVVDFFLQSRYRTVRLSHKYILIWIPVGMFGYLVYSYFWRWSHPILSQITQQLLTPSIQKLSEVLGARSDLLILFWKSHKWQSWTIWLVVSSYYNSGLERHNAWYNVLKNNKKFVINTVIGKSNVLKMKKMLIWGSLGIYFISF